RQAHDGAVGTAGFAGDLAEAGAGEQAVEERLEGLRALPGVGGGEGLGAERGAAVDTAETRGGAGGAAAGGGGGGGPNAGGGGGAWRCGSGNRFAGSAGG